MSNFRNQKGFTLIELVVVIGILSVLLAITLVAINPARQFAQANNAKRKSDVSTILNAVNQYMADHKGAVPEGVTTVALTIKKVDGADICSLLVPVYIAALPTDPKVGIGANTTVGADVTDCSQVTYDTGYTIVKSTFDDRITVAASTVELSDRVSVTR